MSRSVLLMLGALLTMGATRDHSDHVLSPYCGPAVFRPPAPEPFGSASRRTLACRVYFVHAPRAVLSLSVAANQRDRERGFMEVRALPARVGMIFKFPQGDGSRVFWMKNTFIPLDMVFVRSDGSVSGVAENVPAVTSAMPDERIPRRYGLGQYVIELNAGEAAQDGIAPGTRLTLPYFRAT